VNKKISSLAAFLVLVTVASWAIAPATENGRETNAKRVVDAAVGPVMKKNRIAGMAVGLAVGGKAYVFNYGLASRQPAKPVTDRTLFEIGSVSKTFAATLASYAQVAGFLSLDDPVGKFVPSLRGSAFGKVTVLELATHTPGGLPLQVPDSVHNDAELIQYLKDWSPSCPPATCRTYSNVSAGMLGLVAAASMHRDFAALVQDRLFSGLGMTGSYIHVPIAEMPVYAQGYTSNGVPIRVRPGVLADEAYGVRTTAADLIRFVEANIGEISVEPRLARAIAGTHVGYFRAGVLTQDMIWEQYSYPVAPGTLQAGNGPRMLFESVPATRIVPPEGPRDDVWIDKTGTTNGFGTYVAFVPAKRMGIVILANQSYPIKERVALAYRILSQLGGM